MSNIIMTASGMRVRRRDARHPTTDLSLNGSHVYYLQAERSSDELCPQRKQNHPLIRLARIFTFLSASFIFLALGKDLNAQSTTKIVVRNGVRAVAISGIGEWQNKKALLCSLVTTFGTNLANEKGYLDGPRATFVDDKGFVYVLDYISDNIKIDLNISQLTMRSSLTKQRLAIRSLTLFLAVLST